MDSAEQDERTLEQQSSIAREVAESQPLIGEKIEVAALEPEYKSNPLPGFVKGIRYLSSKYEAMRKVRRDGNCFYRAVLFRTLEQLLELHAKDSAKAEEERDRLLAIVHSSKDWLTGIGYEAMAIETFWEVFVNVLQEVLSWSPEDLLSKMNEDGGEGEYMLWYCRLLTAGHLKLHADKYVAFIDAVAPGMDVNAFCQSEVEPMGKECEQVQMTALTECLNLPVRVEYLDGHDFADKLGKVDLPNDEQPPLVTLLYRPGHYDILYEQR